MTTTQALGKIERVDPRSVWPHESQDFTPWLAAHIEELGEALGLDLELDSTEAPVGGFSLDILASEVGRDRKITIENQLEETDHSHLGQLLTYAAGYDAGVVVWIAKEFRDEHRAALDLLNRHTDEEMEFFGVVIEVWKIADSPPAPNFRVVSAPNDWRKRAKLQDGNNVKDHVSDRGERYRKFHQQLIDVLRTKHSFTNATKGQPLNWYEFSAGHGSRIRYAVALAAHAKAEVGLYIDNADAGKDWNERLFESLIQQKDAIESELDHKLDWRKLDNRRACRIVLERPGSIDDGDEKLNDIRAWMVQNLLAFRETFRPRLEDLIRRTPQGDSDEEERDDESDD